MVASYRRVDESTPISQNAGRTDAGTFPNLANRSDLQLPNVANRSSSVFSTISEIVISSIKVCGIPVPGNFWQKVYAVIFQLVSSLACVYANKYLFSNYKFPLLFANFLQMAASIVLSFLIGSLSQIQCGSKRPLQCFSFWPKFTWELKTALQLLPVALLFIPRVSLTGWAIKVTQVSTYQVTRATAIIFSLILQSLMFRQVPTVISMISVVGIFVGCALPYIFTSSLTPFNLSVGLFSSFIVALYMVFVKRFMQLVNNNSCIMMNYNAVWSVILLPPLILLFERNSLMRFFPFGGQTDPSLNLPKVWGLVSLSCVAAFFTSISGMLVLQVSTPVTYDVVGTIKGALQTVGGVVIFGDTRQPPEVAGIAISLASSLLYGVGKQREHAKSLATKNKLPR